MAQDVPDHLKSWIGLLSSKGPKQAALRRALDGHANVFELSDCGLRQLGFDDAQIKNIRTPPLHLVKQVEDWLTKSNQNHILSMLCDNYPERLRQIPSPPPLLFVTGDTSLLSLHGIAVVGSRKPTAPAKRVAHTLSAQLASLGLCVTSGMALGIDACAHRGALDSGGLTVAVLGSGLNQLYPKRNVSLASELILKNGALVSEFFPDAPPLPEHFPRRNRIVSGLTLGTLVVEATLRSGSLITARCALDQNREVFAVPGPVNNPQSAGCHYLIKHGAKLVESPIDIIEEFQNVSFSMPQQGRKNFGKSPLQALASDPLLDSVDYEVTALDVVADRSNLPIRAVLAKLLEYELRGLVAAVPGGYIKLGEK